MPGVAGKENLKIKSFLLSGTVVWRKAMGAAENS